MNLLNKKRPESHSNIQRKKPMQTSILSWFVMAMLCFVILPINDASAETRTLKLYFLHTKEKAAITFKKDGRYVPSGLKKINRFLRDWRRNEPTKMDPKLLDLIWEVYQEVGGKKHIHVVSAYRSVKTNNLLRKRGRGVAKNSQHSLGKAMDFFIPGVKLATLRKVGLRMGLGGVGYYPRSGSPFVHLDTGRVRHWPRMSRKQLVRVFPKGKTLHVPTDGKPLPGYKTAKLEYERKIKNRSGIRKQNIAKKPSIIASNSNRDRDEDGVLAAVTPKAVTSTTTVEASKPAATISNTPAPEPAAPAPASDPSLVALLPNINRVPIPITAPRSGRSNGTALALATTVNDEPDVLSNEGTQEQLAFAAPVPVKRPSLNVGETSSEQIIPQAPVEPGIQVAALSPTEINDLRRQVYSTLQSNDGDNNSASVPKKPIPFSPPLDEIEKSPFSPPLAEVENNPFSPPLDEVENIELVALEPGVKSTGILAIPTSNPIPKPQPEAVDTAALNVAVPTKNPLAGQVIKQPEQDVAQVEEEASTQPSTQSGKRAVVGKWVMVNNASISQIADIHAPDYSLNILRERPNRVLASGFSKVQVGAVTDTFTGSSLEFLDFTKLN